MSTSLPYVGVTMLERLKERKLVQWTLAYLAGAWFALEVVSTLQEGLGWSSRVFPAVLVALAAGLPLTLVLAWYHGERGRQRLSGPELLIIAGILLAGTLLVGTVMAPDGWLRGDGGPLESYGPLSPDPAVAPGAEVIAVLPFRTSGDGLEHLREGMMDLLSRSLTQSDAIVAVDPRAVLKHLSEIEADESVDVGRARAVGSRVGATSVLLGSAVAAGSAVRLDAVLYETSGRSLVAAQATGAPDSVLALADELAVSLVRELWRSSAPTPSLDIAAITTRSPEALRAFLDGERLYRQGDMREARRSLERAVGHDSTFALAHHRLAWVDAWTNGLGSPTALAHLRTASRHAHRLPERERVLVEGFLMLNEGRLEEGYGPIRSYVGRWPDDPEAWIVLANLQFHHADWMGLGTSEILEPFDRVIALDSTLTPAYLHPAEIALFNRDRGLFERYMGPLRRHGAGGPMIDQLLQWAAACFRETGTDEPLPDPETLSGEPEYPPPCARIGTP